jgi:hypothetical protein
MNDNNYLNSYSNNYLNNNNTGTRPSMWGYLAGGAVVMMGAAYFAMQRDARHDRYNTTTLLC